MIPVQVRTNKRKKKREKSKANPHAEDSLLLSQISHSENSPSRSFNLRMYTWHSGRCSKKRMYRNRTTGVSHGCVRLVSSTDTTRAIILFYLYINHNYYLSASNGHWQNMLKSAGYCTSHQSCHKRNKHVAVPDEQNGTYQAKKSKPKHTQSIPSLKVFLERIELRDTDSGSDMN